MSITVVGNTTNSEVYIATNERKFIINEYLIIEDNDNDEPIVEIIETNSFNKFVPLASEKAGIMEDTVKQNLSSYGYDLDDETINLAKVRVVGELSKPITVGSTVRLPKFNEVKHLLMKKKPNKGLTLGVIRGTSEMQDSLPNDVSNIAMLYKDDIGVLDQEGVPFVFDYYKTAQYPHMLVTGGSGSGKSYGTRVLLEEKMQKKIPMIVFDPHYEMDFSETFEGLPVNYQYDYKRHYEIAYVGRDVGVDFTELSKEELSSLLSSAKNMTSTMETTLAVVLEKRDTLTSFQTKLNNLMEIYQDGTGEYEVRRSEGDKVATKALELYNRTKRELGTATLMALSGIGWRLENIKATGIFNCNIDSIHNAILKRKTIIIRSNIRLLKTFAGFIINNLYKKRRKYIDSQNTLTQEQIKQLNIEKFPPFEVVIDESHNFAPKTIEGENMTPTKWIIREISAEGRKYGINLVLVTQRPSNLDTTTLANVNTKFIYRTNNSYDLATISEETDLTGAELDRLKYFQSGNCFISSAIQGRSLALTTRVSKTQSPHFKNPYDELDEFGENNDKLKEVLKKYLPLSDMNLANYHMDINNEVKKTIPSKEIFETLEEMYRSGEIDIKDSPLGKQYVEK
ncbi:ATP-binding protein [Senegalia massiliensis]|uniref:ATP-binding protein n=1 Tax=Senegalia massiliensis TaxID=1720316 RepID=A0A845R2G6_9CLOT|nr:ATP-binding protein [Senegalia massiliensis]NBI07622.1 ATP-binding protein [Senegalia massiliensis]